MIYTDSRYSTGKLYSAWNTRKYDTDVFVSREFPRGRAQYFMYTWRESDRIDLVANRFFKTPAVWWKIMDYNPEIGNPFEIPVGTVIRIPHVR
jgi:hypothetical protein